MKLLTLTGPSCSGKTTLLNKLVAEHNFVSVVSHTTRPIRDGEIDGKDYHFINSALFESMKRQGMFIEHISFSGFSYGVSADELAKATVTGQTAVLIVEPVGLKQILKYSKENDISVTTCYIDGLISDLVSRYLMRSAGEDLNDPSIAARHARRVISLINEHKNWGLSQDPNKPSHWNDIPYDIYFEDMTSESETTNIEFIKGIFEQ